jgi:hypothetical protein
LNEEDAALRIQCRVRGNAERASVDREQLGASEWCGQFFDAVDVDEHGLIGKAELILVSEAFGDNVHKARARASEILAAAPPSMATAAGLVDRGTFVSYWVGVTRDLQSRRGSYSVAHVLTLRDQLSSLEEKLFEAARFVDADLCQQPGAEDEYTAAAIRVQTAARGYAGRKELNRLRDAREAAAEAQRVEKAEREASKAAARAARVAAAEQRQREAAATLVQSHARGFMGRRRQHTDVASVDMDDNVAGEQEQPAGEQEGIPPTIDFGKDLAANLWGGEHGELRVESAQSTAPSEAVPPAAGPSSPSSPLSPSDHSPQPSTARDEAAIRRQPQPLATPNRGTNAHVGPAQKYAPGAVLSSETLADELLRQRKHAIAAALLAEENGDRRRALLSYFTAVKLSLRLLTEAQAELSERSRIAVSLAAKAMTARAISLQPRGRTRAGCGPVVDTDLEQQEAVSRAMQADVLGGDAIAALELYRSAIARAVAADNWLPPVPAALVSSAT